VPKFDDTAQLLKAARRQFGLSQEEFASLLGIKLSRLQKWESGVNEPQFTIRELRRLRQINLQIFEAIMSGFLPLQFPTLLEYVHPKPRPEPAQSCLPSESEGNSRS
jgi:transcriptional regulator with XRE-family HTH domain